MRKLNTEKRINELFNMLVPNIGHCETIEGEMVRAISKINYRYYNDGDIFYDGYGAETCGNAVSFLEHSDEIPKEFRDKISFKFGEIVGGMLDGDDYINKLFEITELIIEYVTDKLDNNTLIQNILNIDMYDFESDYKNDYEDEDDDEYDEYDEYFNDEYDKAYEEANGEY